MNNQGYTYKPGLYLINRSLGRVGYRAEKKTDVLTYYFTKFLWILEKRNFEVRVINTSKILYELEYVKVYQEK